MTPAANASAPGQEGEGRRRQDPGDRGRRGPGSRRPRRSRPRASRPSAACPGRAPRRRRPRPARGRPPARGRRRSAAEGRRWRRRGSRPCRRADPSSRAPAERRRGRRRRRASGAVVGAGVADGRHGHGHLRGRRRDEGDAGRQAGGHGHGERPGAQPGHVEAGRDLRPDRRRRAPRASRPRSGARGRPPAGRRGPGSPLTISTPASKVRVPVRGRIVIVTRTWSTPRAATPSGRSSPTVVSTSAVAPGDRDRPRVDRDEAGQRVGLALDRHEGRLDLDRGDLDRRRRRARDDRVHGQRPGRELAPDLDRHPHRARAGRRRRPRPRRWRRPAAGRPSR